jgi:hypothetical protein
MPPASWEAHSLASARNPPAPGRPPPDHRGPSGVTPRQSPKPALNGTGPTATLHLHQHRRNSCHHRHFTTGSGPSPTRTAQKGVSRLSRGGLDLSVQPGPPRAPPRSHGMVGAADTTRQPHRDTGRTTTLGTGYATSQPIHTSAPILAHAPTERHPTTKPNRLTSPTWCPRTTRATGPSRRGHCVIVTHLANTTAININHHHRQCYYRTWAKLSCAPRIRASRTREVDYNY